MRRLSLANAPTPTLRKQRAGCWGFAHTIEPIQDGRIHIEKRNGPFLSQEGGNPAEYKAGLEFAIARGWLWRHESCTFLKFTPAGADLFA
jgi:hypothetical protein